MMLMLITIFPLPKAMNQNTLNYHPASYTNLRLWDPSMNQCFFYQKTNNACVLTSVQIVLKYINFSPLPTQTELATEMNTDINHTTQWRYAHIPFNKRGFNDYYNESLSLDFNRALSNLKGNISQNFPAIVDTWYDEHAKLEAKVTHARVVTGYNSTGIFFHDPLAGRNMFLNNSAFADLWKTDMGYWALIIKYQPRFDLIVTITDIFGVPVSGVEVTLGNRANATKATDPNGRVRFFNLSISEYTITYNWRFVTTQENFAVTHTTSRNHVTFSDLTFATVIIIALIIFGLVTSVRKRKTEIKRRN